MSKKKIAAGIIGGIAALILIIFFVVSGNKKPDPAGYVSANLHLVFQGDTDGASQYLDTTSDELEDIYEAGIENFVASYLMGDLDVDSAYTSTYGYLLKEIFAVMRYEVGDAEEVAKDTYKVPVTYQPVDIFTKFIPEIEKESKKIQQALNSGAYGEKKEDAQVSALQDYLNLAYEKLEMAYLEMEYGEKDTYEITVKVKADGTMEVQDNGINTFIERILELDKL